MSPFRKAFLNIAALSFASTAIHAADAKRPHIIVIVSDDQGYADAGFQGSKNIATPNLDAMAKDGVRCTRGYVTAPVCSPSRAGLMTGRYQEKFGHHNNIVAESALPFAHLPSDETLLPQVLAKAGYHTAMVGKWHLGQQDGCRPYERGFQEFFGIVTGGHDYFINNPDQRAIKDSDYKARIERDGPVGEKVTGYLTDAFGADAVRIIRESHTKRPDQPLFLYLAFNAPHTPTQAPEELVEAMPATLEGKERRTYAAQVASMDTAIGKVRAALRETGMEKNTFIVFFSDNGGARHDYYDNTPLRDYKGSLYEGGVRVPFFAVYPGGIPAGSVCDLPVTSLDVFATACALADTKPETGHPLDSADMLPVLAGEAKQPTHDALFWNFPGFGAAVAAGDLKLVVPKQGKPQLFDLAADIGEKNDLAAQRPEDVARLTSLLEKWQAQTVRPLWGPGSQGRAGADAASQNAPATTSDMTPPSAIAADAAQWKLVWRDEFDGTKWTAQAVPRKDAQNTPDAATVRDGIMTITTWTDAGKHSTGFLRSIGKFETTYGYFEARIRFHTTPGQWGAFWLTSPSLGKPLGDVAKAGAEIDVIEHRSVYGGDKAADASNLHAMALHWDGYGEHHQSKGHPGHPAPGTPSLQGNWHTYAVLWTPKKYVFYLDGQEQWTTDQAVSQRPEFLLLTCEVQEHGWAGDVPEGGFGRREESKTKMEVDWVRVWQKSLGPKEPPTPASSELRSTPLSPEGKKKVNDDGKAGQSGKPE